MSELLHPNNWLIRFLTRICDLLLLNILFLLACMTVICSGAAITALYRMTLRLIRGESTSIVMGFLTALREDFSASVPATILLFGDLMLIGVVRYALYADFLVFSPVVFILLSIATTVLTALLSYLFPLLARYENSFPHQMENAGRLALANLPVTCLITVVNLLPLLIGICLPDLWIFFTAFWALIGAAAGAYVNSYYLNRIFLMTVTAYNPQRSRFFLKRTFKEEQNAKFPFL